MDKAAQQDLDVQALICERIQHAVDISDVFNKVAIHAGKASPKTLVFAAHRVARYCRLRKQDIGTTRRSARWVALLTEIHSGLSELDPQALTDIAWALAVVGQKELRLLAGLCHQIFARVEDLAPQNLAITAWSFATLGYRDDLVMKRINRQVLTRLKEFEAQSLANTAWALATMRFKDDVLMHHIAKETLTKVGFLSAQHLANMAWSYANLGRRAETLFIALEGRAVDLLLDPQVDFCPLDLALCSWAYAWLEHSGPSSALLRGIIPVAVRRLDEFSTQQLANMLWGFDHSNYEDPAFYSTVARWCCSRPSTYWDRAAGEEMVSIMNALKPRVNTQAGWHQLEEVFRERALRPLVSFLREVHSSEAYAQGLRRLRTWHAGARYTGWLLEELGLTYLGTPDDSRTPAKVEALLDFFLMPPEPQWLPDGYDDDNIQANRAEIPSLLELCDVKRRVQPSSHFLALHLSAELKQEIPGQEAEVITISRAVPTRPPRRSGLSFVRGEKFEDHQESGDEDGPLRTSTLRDYRRKHHAEVTALTQLAEAIETLQQRGAARLGTDADLPAVTGWVELFGAHYPCSSCVGAIVQFCGRYAGIEMRIGHDDWRHFLRRLRERWDPTDTRHHLLSINARQLRELDLDLGPAIPMGYRAALRSTLGTVEGLDGNATKESILPKRQSFY